MQKLQNNEARPKFTGSYKKKRVFQARVLFCRGVFATNHLLLFIQYECEKNLITLKRNLITL